MIALAYDGSLKFDTKMNTDGFDDGISTLHRAIDRLSLTIDRLSRSITGAFKDMGKSTEAVSVKSAEAAAGIDGIGQAAEQSEAKVKSLQEQMDAITVQTMQDDVPGTTQMPASAPVDVKSMQYDAKAMEMVFGEAAVAIRSYADAVAQYGNAAGMAMNQMEAQGGEAAAALQADADQTADTIQADAGQAAAHINQMRAELDAADAALKGLQAQGFYFGDEENMTRHM